MRSQIGKLKEELHRKIDGAAHFKQSVIKGYSILFEKNEKISTSR